MDTPPRAAVILDPGKLAVADAVQWHLMIAEALVDADAPGFARIADIFLTSSRADNRVWRTLFGCWMKADPKKAWCFANQHREPAADINLPLIALEQWAACDSQAARKILEVPDAEQYAALICGAIKHDVEGGFRLMEESLVAAGRKVDENSLPSMAAEWDLRMLFTQLARVNPSYAVTWVERLKDRNLLGNVFVGWMDHNPTEARKWLEQQKDAGNILIWSVRAMTSHPGDYRPKTMDVCMMVIPPGNDKSEVVTDGLVCLAHQDPDMAIKEANRLFADPLARAAVLGNIAGALVETDFSRAWDILNLVSPSNRKIHGREPPAIEVRDHGDFREVGRLKDYPMGRTGVETPIEIKAKLLAGLIEVDKSQALRLMEKLPAEEVAALVPGDGIQQWHNENPIEAVTWLAGKLGRAGDPTEIKNWLDCPDLYGDDLQSLVGGLPDGTVRTALSIRVANELVDVDPLQALQFARESSLSAEVADSVYELWIYSDPKVALEHLSSDPDASPSAWENLVEKTFEKLPNEISEAVESLPPGEMRDAAVSAIIKKSKPASDPLRVVEWALSINDEESRHKAVESVINRISLDLRTAWNEETMNAMRGLIQQSDHIPENERNAWLERINQESDIP